jgi:phosphoenolpyruvate carboxykinase (ATP)
MNEIGLKANDFSIAELGLENVEMAYWNLHPSELVEETIIRGQGELTDVGALAIDTGEFTGRSPKDKYVVYDENTKDSVWWGDVNNRFESDKFDALHNRMLAYLGSKEVWIRLLDGIRTTINENGNGIIAHNVGWLIHIDNLV